MVTRKLVKLYIKWRVEDMDRIINDKTGFDTRWHDNFMLIPDILMFEIIIKMVLRR